MDPTSIVGLPLVELEAMLNRASHEILLNFTPLETRVAVVEQGMLPEIFIDELHIEALWVTSI